MRADSTVAARVIRITGKFAQGFEVRIDSTFEELNIDSFSVIEMLFEIEEEFDIEISNDGVRGILGVREMVAGIEGLLAEKAAAETVKP